MTPTIEANKYSGSCIITMLFLSSDGSSSSYTYYLCTGGLLVQMTAKKVANWLIAALL